MVGWENLEERMSYKYPKSKYKFFKKYPKLCDKFLLGETPNWYDEGLKDFMNLC